MIVNLIAGDRAASIEAEVNAPSQKDWVNSVVVVLLAIFAANLFAAEWVAFRGAVHPVGSAIDFPHYYVAAKVAGLPNPSQHLLYYNGRYHDDKEEVLDRIPPDTEWNRIARQNGLTDTLHYSAPPIVATLLVPFGKLPYQLAFMVWRILAEISFFAAIWICLKLCHAFSPVTLLICTLAGFAFEPFTLTLDKGQFGALLLLTWSASVFFARKKLDVLSALMLALATIVKLTPILAVGVFVVRRRWKWLAAYVLWITILTGVGVWHLGVENHRLYLAKLAKLSCGVPGPYNYSLNGIVQNVYYGNILDYDHIPAQAPRGLCAFNKVLGLAAYLIVLLYLMKKNQRGDIVWDMVVMSLLILLIAPFTWRHYYVLEVLPLMFTWFLVRAGRFSRPRWVLSVAIGCTLIAGTYYPDYLHPHFNNGPVKVFLVALLPLSTLMLMATILFAYKPEPATAGVA